MEHHAPRGIVVVDCATHASCHASQMTQYATLLLPLDMLLQQRSLLGLLDEFQ